MQRKKHRESNEKAMKKQWQGKSKEKARKSKEHARKMQGKSKEKAKQCRGKRSIEKATKRQ